MLFFLFFPVLKNVYIKSIFVLFDILLIIFSGSGNIIVFIISLLVYFMLTIKTHHNAITLVVRRSTFYIVCVFAIGILYYLFGMNGWQSVSSAVSWSFSGGSISNSIDRYNNIIRSIKLIPEIPLGTGYNMIYSYNQVYHPELGSLGSYSYGTSSFILKLILEIGFLGALAYVGFILNCSKKLLRYKYNLENNIGLAVSLLSIFLLQSMNGIAYKPYFMVAFGLALYELRKV